MERTRIYLHCRDEANNEYKRLRRIRRTGWEFLLRGFWAAGPINETMKSVWFSHNLDRTSWAILETGYRRKIVAVCECDSSSSTEELVAAMMSALDKERRGAYDWPELQGAIDFDRFWLKYAGKLPQKGSERSTPRHRKVFGAASRSKSTVPVLEHSSKGHF